MIMSDPLKYGGAYSGTEIDAALGRVFTPQTTPQSGSNYLISSGAVYAATANEIIKVNVTGITGTGSVVSDTIQFPVPSSTGYSPRITAQHEVVSAVFSSQEAVVGGLTVTTGADTLTYSVKVNGTTDLTLKLERIGGSLP